MLKTQEQGEYNRTANKKLDKVNAKPIELLARKSDVERFLNTLQNIDASVTEFLDNLWLNTITSVTVHQSCELVFTFKDGTDIKI